MFLAPLNYDRFFRKVFSHLHIAKRFLEDFLDVEIQHIELLKEKHLLTDDSSKMEFDFRCTIGNTDVIIDMQQWYKSDVVQRFYTYHAAGTVLQLEKMPQKVLSTEIKDKRIKEKDYKGLKPVLTLIWMGDDTLYFKENYIGYIMTPEMVTDFIKNVKLWKNPEIVHLLEARKKVLKVLGNEEKDLDFLPKNRLVFMFQTNIVKDPALKKYHRWFRFAEKTKDENNTEEDFGEFNGDPVFMDIIRLINRKQLTKEDLNYIESEAETLEMYERYLQGERKLYRKDALNEGLRMGIEKGEKIGIEKGEKIGIEKGEKIGIEKGEKIGVQKIATSMLIEGESNEKISRYTSLSDSDIERLRKELNP